MKLIRKESYYTTNSAIVWETISKDYELDDDFIREFADKLDWFWLSCKQKLSKDIAREFSDRIVWRIFNNWENRKEFREIKWNHYDL